MSLKEEEVIIEGLDEDSSNMLSGNLNNLSGSAFQFQQSDADALNETWAGGKENEAFTVKDGDLYFGDTIISDSMTETERVTAMNKETSALQLLSKGEENRPEAPSQKQVNDAKSKHEDSTTSINNVAEANGGATSEKFQEIVTNLLEKLTKVGLYAGATIAMAQILADGQTGCYAESGGNSLKISTSTSCTCADNFNWCQQNCSNSQWLPSSDNYGYCSQCCVGNTSGTTPCKCTPTTSSSSSSSSSASSDLCGSTVTCGKTGIAKACNCISKTGTEDIALVYKKVTWQDVITNVAETGGYFITQVGNEGLDLGKDLDKFLSGKWFIWVLIVLGVIALVVVLAITIPKHKKSK